MTENPADYDIHDPRAHFRKLLIEMFPDLTAHLMRIHEAYNTENMIEMAKANQALGVWVGQQMQEANRLGAAEGREDRDVSDIVFRGAMALLGNGYMDDTTTGREVRRRFAIRDSRLLWDDVRKTLLVEQAERRTKQQLEANAMVEQLGRDLSSKA